MKDEPIEELCASVADLLLTITQHINEQLTLCSFAVSDTKRQ